MFAQGGPPRPVPQIETGNALREMKRAALDEAMKSTRKWNSIVDTPAFFSCVITGRSSNDLSE